MVATGARKLNAVVQAKDGETRIRLEGVIDEDVDELDPLIGRLRPGTVVIDLAGIDRLNSMGVRTWVTWLGRIEKLGSHPILERCSRAIVAQINLIHNFTGVGGRVRSFFAPYYCLHCDREQQILLQVAELAPPVTPPAVRCDECDRPMEFDDVAEAYFTFVERVRAAPPAPAEATGPTAPARPQLRAPVVETPTRTDRPPGGGTPAGAAASAAARAGTSRPGTTQPGTPRPRPSPHDETAVVDPSGSEPSRPSRPGSIPPLLTLTAPASASTPASATAPTAPVAAAPAPAAAPAASPAMQGPWPAPAAAAAPSRPPIGLVAAVVLGVVAGVVAFLLLTVGG